MKLGKLLFKPNWQDKDANVRRAAVVTDADAELVTALPEIARRDADAGVRLAALQRLNDYEAWRERSTGDPEAQLRTAAREAYLSLLCSGGANAPAIGRRTAELETLSETEIERVATVAADALLRREALARITRVTLIAQRAVADPDPALRLALLERVCDATLLERIAERTRKTDKAVSRRARELLQAAGIAKGDVDAIAQKARRLCEGVEALMRAPHAHAAAELDDIDTQWSVLESSVAAELLARFRGAYRLARSALAARASPIPSAVEPAVEPAPLATADHSTVGDPEAHAAAREQRFRRKTQRHAIEQRLAEFSAALASGDTAVAHRMHAQIEDAIAAQGNAAHELRNTLEPLLARYAELKRWQHWSNNQRRRALCADIEGLIEAGAHPDAVATRVREAREEWQRLNVAEGFADDTQASDGIARRFNGLCHSALRPTKAYFAKRKEVRQTHTHETEELLAHAAAIADDSEAWNDVAETRARASTALRSLDGVEPRLRTQLAKRLKDAIARMATLSAAHERDIESAKGRLIEQATALAERGDGPATARETRELQKRWTALGKGRRDTDQRQWRQFRGACDAVFARLDAARTQRETAASSAREEAQRVLDEFAALATNPCNEGESVKKQLRELDSRWLAVGSDDRAQLKRQRELREAISMRIKESARQLRLARFSIAMEKYTLLRRLETGTPDIASGWDELPACAEFDAPLTDRRARVGTPAAAFADDTASREILVRLEFLAGVDSAPEDRKLRMSHQVQRLSDRLREGAAATPENELSELLCAWFAQDPQTPTLEDRFAVAAKAAIDSLP